MKPLLLLLASLALAKGDPHPRLLFPAALQGDVEERIGSDPLASDIEAAILARAGKVLTDRTCEYRIPDGKRLLSESRLALNNVLHCAWAWRLTNDIRFRDRVIRELDAACALQDWNPSHFLDVAEMSTAVAIGYDWLYPDLSPEQRTRYEDALLDKALRVVGVKHQASKWWTGPDNNWTQVCGSGMALAAEAVRERDPALCEPISAHGRELIEKCRSFYQPDGAFPEGPSYWHYGTNYEVLLLAARQTLAQPVEVTPLLHASGDFMMHVTGPSRVSFNYADGNASTEIPSPAQSWIATQFKDPGQARHVRALLKLGLPEVAKGGGATGDLRFFPLHLLWLPAPPAAAKGKEKDKRAGDTPLAAVFRGEQAFAFFRSAWTPDAAWLAIKGGTGAASHGHLDAGSFVYEAAGVRWFHDLGKEDYNLPGYFGKNRWDYLRLTNLSHNTLVIGGKLQATPKEGCPVSALQTTKDGPQETTIDLSTAYIGQAAKVTRLIRFDPADGSVTLTDSIEKPAAPIRWAIVTKAKPTIDGPRLILEESNKRLTLTRHDNSGGAWEEYSLKPATEKEQQNKGYRLLGFTTTSADNLELKVSWKTE